MDASKIDCFPVKTLPLSVRICSDHALASQRLHQRIADRLGGGPHDKAGADAEPRVIVDPGDREELLGSVAQEYLTRDIHLPRLQRS